METTHKFHVWIVLLLAWNMALLLLVLAFIYFDPGPAADSGQVALECAAATLNALQDTCSNL